ncbi:MAG TPA: WD40 repeat domain-containing protein [Gammaproteobacteria bacterium]|nr:WD40 repeat domain-containing protein [Gammaproteobacteria bacterium]
MTKTVFYRHKGPVSSVAQIPGSNEIISAAYDNAVALFDAETRDVTLLGYHAHPVNKVCVSQSGNYAVSASSDCNLYLWNLKNNQLEQVLKGHSSDVEDFVFINDELGASASRDWRIIIWNLKTGAIVRILSGHEGDVTSIYYFDGKLYSYSLDRTLRIWALNSGRQLKTTGPFNTDTTSFAINAERNRFVLGSDSGLIEVFNINTGRIISSIRGHQFAIKKVMISPENGDILSAAYDQKIQLWNPATFKIKQTLEVHDSLWERSLNWSLDNSQVIGGTFDGTVLIWDIHSGKCIQELGSDGKNCGNACFNDIASQGNEQITLVSDDGYVRVGILSEKNARWQQCVEPESGRVLMNAVAFCPENKHVITGAHNHNLYLFNNHRQQLKQKLHIELNEGPINCIRISTLNEHEGEMFIACYSGILAHLSAKGQLLNKIPVHECTIRALALHPLHPAGVSCCFNGTLASWHYNGKLIREYIGHNTTVDAVDIDPSGRFIASMGRDYMLKVHGFTDGILYHSIHLGQCTPTSLCFVNPHLVIVSSHQGELIRVCLDDATTIRQAIAQNGISAIARHGEHYVASSYDGNVYLVDQNQLTVLNSLHLMTQQTEAPSFV